MTTTERTGIASLPMPDLSSTFPGPFPTSPHADHIGKHLVQWLLRFPLLGPPDALRTLCDIVAHGVARTFLPPNRTVSSSARTSSCGSPRSTTPTARRRRQAARPDWCAGSGAASTSWPTASRPATPTPSTEHSTTSS